MSLTEAAPAEAPQRWSHRHQRLQQPQEALLSAGRGMRAVRALRQPLAAGRARVRQPAQKPFTPQQHAVVAALMVVMKRAKLEGHVASITARARLICNNKYTLVVMQYIGDGEGLPSMRRSLSRWCRETTGI